MRKYLWTLLLLSILYLGSAVLTKGVWAATLNFDQSTINVSAGSSFQVQVIVNSGTDKVAGADAWILYDSNILKATSGVAGSYFQSASIDVNTPGKIYVGAVEVDTATYKDAGTSGTIATITFSALKNGSSTLVFECQDSGETSKVDKYGDANVPNVIVCSQNGSSTVTVGSGSSSAPTATPAPGSSANPTSTPAPGGSSAPPPSLPKSGVIDNLINAAVPGAGLLIIGVVLKFLL